MALSANYVLTTAILAQVLQVAHNVKLDTSKILMVPVFKIVLMAYMLILLLKLVNSVKFLVVHNVLINSHALYVIQGSL